jgi:hypothetical protein
MHIVSMFAKGADEKLILEKDHGRQHSEKRQAE